MYISQRGGLSDTPNLGRVVGSGDTPVPDKTTLLNSEFCIVWPSHRSSTFHRYTRFDVEENKVAMSQYIPMQLLLLMPEAMFLFYSSYSCVTMNITAKK